MEVNRSCLLDMTMLIFMSPWKISPFGCNGTVINSSISRLDWKEGRMYEIGASWIRNMFWSFSQLGGQGIPADDQISWFKLVIHERGRFQQCFQDLHSPPPPKVGVGTSEKYWILHSSAVSLFLYLRQIWRCGKLKCVLKQTWLCIQTCRNPFSPNHLHPTP